MADDTYRLDITDDGTIQKIVDAMTQLGVKSDAAFKRVQDGFSRLGTTAQTASNAQKILADAEARTGQNATIAAAALQRMTNAEINAANAAKKMSDSHGQAANSFSAFGKAAQLAAGYLSVHAYSEASDVYIKISNSIKQATTTSAEFNSVYASLQKTSLDTGTSLEGNTKLFFGMQSATKAAHISVSDLTKAVDTIAKTFRAAGTSTAEANRTIREFAEVLSKDGAQSGRQFLSILTNAPQIIDVLAKGLNVTRHEVLELAKSGELTAAKVIAILDKMNDAQTKLAASMQGTISGAIENINTKWIDYIGHLDEASGMHKLVIAGLGGIANNLNTIIPLIAAFAAAWVLGTVIESITSIIKGIQGLSKAMLALNVVSWLNPWAIGLAGIAVAILVISNNWGKVASMLGLVDDKNKSIVQSNNAIADSANKAAAAQSQISDSPQGVQSRQFNDNKGTSVLDRSAPYTNNAPATGTGVQVTPYAQTPTARTGLDFTVPGVGTSGPDSRLVQFMATPGEQVTVNTPAQQMLDGLPKFRNGGSIGITGDLRGINVNYVASNDNAVTGFKASPQATLPPHLAAVVKAITQNAPQVTYPSAMPSVTSFGNTPAASGTATASAGPMQAVLPNGTTFNPQQLFDNYMTNELNLNLFGSEVSGGYGGAATFSYSGPDGNYQTQFEADEAWMKFARAYGAQPWSNAKRMQMTNQLARGNGSYNTSYFSGFTVDQSTSAFAGGGAASTAFNQEQYTSGTRLIGSSDYGYVGTVTGDTGANFAGGVIPGSAEWWNNQFSAQNAANAQRGTPIANIGGGGGGQQQANPTYTSGAAPYPFISGGGSGYSNVGGGSIMGGPRSNSVGGVSRITPLSGPSGAIRDLTGTASGQGLQTYNRGTNSWSFREGGDFTVPGAGGVDSRMIAMHVSPGEEVSVRNRQQQAEATRGSPGKATVINMVIKTPDANSFRRSSQQIQNDMYGRLRRFNNR